MACEIIQIDGDFVSFRISGILRMADMRSLQNAAKELIDQGMKVRCLIVIDDFQGFEKGVDWGDIDFLVEHGNDIARMAIVGDEKGKEEAFAFVGKGLRTTEIEFFPPSSLKQAESWVRA